LRNWLAIDMVNLHRYLNDLASQVDIRAWMAHRVPSDMAVDANNQLLVDRLPASQFIAKLFMTMASLESGSDTLSSAFFFSDMCHHPSMLGLIFEVRSSAAAHHHACLKIVSVSSQICVDLII
jgi:hypothetical protein